MKPASCPNDHLSVKYHGRARLIAGGCHMKQSRLLEDRFHYVQTEFALLVLHCCRALFCWRILVIDLHIKALPLELPLTKYNNLQSFESRYKNPLNHKYSRYHHYKPTSSQCCPHTCQPNPYSSPHFNLTSKGSSQPAPQPWTPGSGKLQDN